MAQPPPLELFLITLAQSQDDVILEGVDADKRPARLAVSGFRPHFYVGPVADGVDAAERREKHAERVADDAERRCEALASELAPEQRLTTVLRYVHGPVRAPSMRTRDA